MDRNRLTLRGAKLSFFRIIYDVMSFHRKLTYKEADFETHKKEVEKLRCPYECPSDQTTILPVQEKGIEKDDRDI